MGHPGPGSGPPPPSLGTGLVPATDSGGSPPCPWGGTRGGMPG